MRTASFFILSLGLHLGVLVYPATFAVRGSIEPVRVTILPAENPQSADAGGGNNVASPFVTKSISRAVPPSVTAASPVESKPATVAPQGVTNPSEIMTANDSEISLIVARTASLTIQPDSTADFPVGAAHETAGIAGESAGTSVRSNGNGAGWGSGSGAGSKSGSSGSSVSLVQASYSDTPRPEYPESARREGREGKVLLRVLIDDQGRTKAVEINTSSGTPVLDRAAAEAIRRWRFHPARYGNQPIESWMRIPIEFHLADAKAW